MSDKERKSILVVTLSNIGDVILTTPVIVALRSYFPGARLTVVVGPKAADLLQGSSQIDRILIYDKRSDWSHKLKLVRELREGFYDYVVDLRNSLLPFLVQAHRRSPILRFDRVKSAREDHLRILHRTIKSNTHTINSRNPQIPFDFFSEQEEAFLLEKLRAKGCDLSEGWLVIAPGAGSEEKRWPLEGFCDVVARLLQASSYNLIIVGSKEEAFLGERLSVINPGQVINLAGEITLRELAALITRSKLLLTNDSACMHLGYELDCPVVALFGPTDHERYGRKGKIWRVLRESSSDLKKLSPEKVFLTCHELLNGTVAAR